MYIRIYEMMNFPRITVERITIGRITIERIIRWCGYPAIASDSPLLSLVPLVRAPSRRRLWYPEASQRTSGSMSTQCQVYAPGWAACGRKKGLDEHTYDV